MHQPTSGTETADAAALRALLRHSLQTAAAYELWAVSANYSAVAQPLYGASRYAWPLSMILPWVTASTVSASSARIGDVCVSEAEVRGYANGSRGSS